MKGDRIDPLIDAWNAASHKDDWLVSVVYQGTFLELVSDELDRVADELAVTQKEMREEDGRTVRSSGLGEGIRRLRARAAELRGES